MIVVLTRRSTPDVVVDMPTVPRAGELVPCCGDVRFRVVRVEWRLDDLSGWYARLRVRMLIRDWLWGGAA